jgi:hypothetical protein
MQSSGVHKSALHVPPPQRNHRRATLTPAQRAQIEDLVEHQPTMEYAEVAARVGCNVPQVQHAVAAAGLRRRPPPMDHLTRQRIQMWFWNGVPAETIRELLADDGETSPYTAAHIRRIGRALHCPRTS